MLKLSRTGIGLLTAQYRSVLKKCMVLNLISAGALVFAGQAAATDYNPSLFTDSSAADIQDELSIMGTQFSPDAVDGADYQGIIIHDGSPTLTNTIVSKDIQGGTYGSGEKFWITNKGITAVGFVKNGISIEPQTSTTISNKHNAQAQDLSYSGGAIQNHNNNGLDSLLVVHNTTFENNSVSDFLFDPSEPKSVGGAILNISDYQNPVAVISTLFPSITNNTIEGSTFRNNFAMNFIQASGGAIYNDAHTPTGEGGSGTMLVVGKLISNGNTFTGNHVGNEDFAGADDTVKTYILGTNSSPVSQTVMLTWQNSDDYASSTNGGITNVASGGAIYNGGGYISTNDSFSSNYATGKYAEGGAIFNADKYTLGSYPEITPEYILNGTSTFSQNYTKSTELRTHEVDGVIGGKALGGAIYNGGLFTMFDDGGTRTLSYNKATAVDLALGGAVYNAGSMEINDATFSNNEAGYIVNLDTTIAGGGALASRVSGASLKTEIYDSQFSYNRVKTASEGYGGALYNNNNLAETVIVDSSFENNNVEVKEINGREAKAYGGAIYNEGAAGAISRLTIQAQNADVKIENNRIHVVSAAESSARSYYGGAIYNGSYGQLTIENSGSGKKLSISNNSANDGGAIYNRADGSNATDGGNSYSTFLLINGVQGNIEISNNTAVNNGGALYNDTRNLGNIGTATISATNSSMIKINSNSATNGAGLYNTNGSDIELRIGNGTIEASNNTASNNGGAIYNHGSTLSIANVGTMGTYDSALLNISGNTAQTGAAIYNVANNGVGSIITGNLTGNTTVLFNGNTASSGIGGAIYNDNQSRMMLNLRDMSIIVFNTTNDDVYNLGTITITGDSLAPQVPSDSAMQTAAININETQVVLNSTFGGTGTYNISNTQLNFGTTGYIEETPEMVLSNNVVNMAHGSYLYLSSDDTLTNNNFDLASDSILRYTDSSTTDTDFYLANTITNRGTVIYRADTGDSDIRVAKAVVNSGIISAADSVITNVHIDTLTSKTGNQIVINLDNPNLKADVLTIDNRIYNTTETPTKITFVDMDNDAISEVTLGEEDKIYFAKTQLAQDLSQYGFSVNAENSSYEIKVGYEENGTVYDWFLYRDQTPVPPEPKGLDPEDLAYIDLPRSAIEQTRGIIFDVTRTNRGQCSCYADNCNYHECRYESAPEKYRLWARPSYRSGTFKKPLETDFKLKGIEFGLDYQPTHSDMIGVFGSYRDGKYENDGGEKGKKFYSPLGGSELTIKSMLAGLYYRKYYGNLYFLGAGYFGKLKVDMEADNKVTASTDGINIGAQAELGYDIRTSKRSLLTPSIRATYDYIKFDDLTDSGDKKAEFGTVNDVELEAALKYEYQFNNEYELPTTGYIKPSVIQTLENGGKVKINNVEYDDTLKNETLGRVEIGADAELIENFSVGAFGNYTFGSDYKAWGVGGNVRIVW